MRRWVVLGDRAVLKDLVKFVCVATRKAQTRDNVLSVLDLIKPVFQGNDELSFGTKATKKDSFSPKRSTKTTQVQ